MNNQESIVPHDIFNGDVHIIHDRTNQRTIQCYLEVMSNRSCVFGQFQPAFTNIHCESITYEGELLLQYAVRLSPVEKAVSSQRVSDFLRHFKYLIALRIMDIQVNERHRAIYYVDCILILILYLKVLSGKLEILGKGIDL